MVCHVYIRPRGANSSYSGLDAEDGVLPEGDAHRLRQVQG